MGIWVVLFIYLLVNIRKISRLQQEISLLKLALEKKGKREEG